MNNTASRAAADRASRYIRDALLQPAQVQDVVLAKADPKAEPRQDVPEQAHGDFGHGDFGHADAS